MLKIFSVYREFISEKRKKQYLSWILLFSFEECIYRLGDGEIAFFPVTAFISFKTFRNDLLGNLDISPSFNIDFLLLQVFVNLEEMFNFFDEMTIDIWEII